MFIELTNDSGVKKLVNLNGIRTIAESGQSGTLLQFQNRTFKAQEEYTFIVEALKKTNLTVDMRQ